MSEEISGTGFLDMKSSTGTVPFQAQPIRMSYLSLNSSSLGISTSELAFPCWLHKMEDGMAQILAVLHDDPQIFSHGIKLLFVLL
jgi:hypothetical protein